MIPIVNDKFRRWPPGPRWFLGLIVGNHRVSLCLREGTNTSNPQELVGSPNATYVFGEPVTLEEVHSAVEGMFNETGPSLVDVFRDRIESVFVAVRTPVVPGEA